MFGNRILAAEDKKPGCYVITMFAALFVVMIVKIVRPETIPFGFWEFFNFKGSLGEVLQTGVPIFVWAGGVTLISIWRGALDKARAQVDAEDFLKVGFILSLIAGVLEELAYRWLIFFSAIFGVKLADLIWGGFLNIHLIRGLYEHILIPIANFFTLGALQPYLYSNLSWAVGAAIISSNGDFRNGHAYLGWLGYINSWFIGMFLFMVMFKYGLLAAMLLHFLYDMLIFFLLYVALAFQESRTEVRRWR